MSRGERLREELGARYPNLERFLGASFHENSGPPEAALAAALSVALPEFKRLAGQELADLLRRAEDGARLRSQLNHGFGVNIRFRKPADARAFAEKVLAGLAAAADGRQRTGAQDR